MRQRMMAYTPRLRKSTAEILTKWKHDRDLAKAGLVEEIDDDAKIRYVPRFYNFTF
jgi:hypothetical protein